MICTVYQLYRNSIKLSENDAKATGTRGWLYFRPALDGRVAYLLRGRRDPLDTSLLEPLFGVEIVLIDKGIRLIGVEMGLSNPRQLQHWWVVPK